MYVCRLIYRGLEQYYVDPIADRKVIRPHSSHKGWRRPFFPRAFPTACRRCLSSITSLVHPVVSHTRCLAFSSALLFSHYFTRFLQHFTNVFVRSFVRSFVSRRRDRRSILPSSRLREVTPRARVVSDKRSHRKSSPRREGAAW